MAGDSMVTNMLYQVGHLHLFVCPSGVRVGIPTADLLISAAVMFVFYVDLHHCRFSEIALIVLSLTCALAVYAVGMFS